MLSVFSEASSLTCRRPHAPCTLQPPIGLVRRSRWLSQYKWKTSWLQEQLQLAAHAFSSSQGKGGARAAPGALAQIVDAKLCMPEQSLDVRLGSMPRRSRDGCVAQPAPRIEGAQAGHAACVAAAHPGFRGAWESAGTARALRARRAWCRSVRQPCVRFGAVTDAAVLCADPLRAFSSKMCPPTHHRADRAAGPGRRFFDLRHWRVVLVDQRACGASTPRGCLTDNTTQV
jgi:hypothetical protein